MARGSGKTRPIEMLIHTKFEEMTPQEKTRWKSKASVAFQELEKTIAQMRAGSLRAASKLETTYSKEIAKKTFSEQQRLQNDIARLKDRHRREQNRLDLEAVKKHSRDILDAEKKLLNDSQRFQRQELAKQERLRRGSMMGALTTGFVADRLAGFAGSIGDRLIRTTATIGKNLFDVASSFEYIRSGIDYAFGARSNEVWGKALENAQTMNISTREVLDTVRSLGVLKVDPFSKMSNPKGGTQTALKSLSDLAALVPQQGMEGALFAIRNALSGQWKSLQMRFDIPKSMVDKIRKQITPGMSDQLMFDTIMQGITNKFGGMMKAVENTSKFHIDNIKDIFTNIVYDVTQSSNKILTPMFKKISDWLSNFRKDKSKIDALSNSVKAIATAVMAVFQPVIWIGKQLLNHPGLVKFTIWAIALLGPLAKLSALTLRMAVGMNLLRIAAMQAGTGSGIGGIMRLASGMSSVTAATETSKAAMIGFGASMRMAMMTTGITAVVTVLGFLAVALFKAKREALDLKNVIQGFDAQSASIAPTQASWAAGELKKDVAGVNFNSLSPGTIDPKKSVFQIEQLVSSAKQAYVPEQDISNLLKSGGLPGLENGVLNSSAVQTAFEQGGYNDMSVKDSSGFPVGFRYFDPKKIANMADAFTSRIQGSALLEAQTPSNVTSARIQRGNLAASIITANKNYGDVRSRDSKIIEMETKGRIKASEASNLIRDFNYQQQLGNTGAVEALYQRHFDSKGIPRGPMQTALANLQGTTYASKYHMGGNLEANTSFFTRAAHELAVNSGDIDTARKRAIYNRKDINLPTAHMTEAELSQTFLDRSKKELDIPDRILRALTAMGYDIQKTEANTEETAKNTKKVEELLPPIFREIFDKFTRRGMLASQGRLAFLNPQGA